MGQVLQIGLQTMGFFQKRFGVVSTFLQRLLGGLAMNDTLFQRSIGRGQLSRALAQRLAQSTQTDIGLEDDLMSVLDGSDGLGKKNLRPFDQPVPAAGGLE